MKKKKKLRSPFRRRKRFPDLLQDLDKADKLLDSGRYEEVIKLLQPYAEKGVRDFDLYAMLGIAYGSLGYTSIAIEHLEKAQSIRKTPELSHILAVVYGSSGLLALAQEAAREAKKHDLFADEMFEALNIFSAYENQVRQIVAQTGVSRSQAEKGLKLMDRAQLAVMRNDFEKAIHLFKAARKYLGDAPSLLNNLSQVYFFSGHPQKAMELAHQVLAEDPNDLHALGNLVRFLAWMGEEEEAQALWERLKPIEPPDEIARLKKAEAAAAMKDDQTVYDLLHGRLEDMEIFPDAYHRAMRFLAVAAANLGKRKEAMALFETLAEIFPAAEMYLEALKQGKPGLGLADRYAHFGGHELVPAPSMEELFALFEEEEESLNPEISRQRIHAFVQRFPQIYRMVEQILWEQEGPPEVIEFLDRIGTPEAYAILKAFALGEKGSKENREYALEVLIDAGVIPPGSTVQFWDGHAFQTISIPQAAPYDEEAFALLKEGLRNTQQGRYEKAREAYQRILERDPYVVEAYHGLASLALLEGRVDEAKAYTQKAIELDPSRVHPRVSLAHIYLEEGRIDKAKAIIEPVADLSSQSPDAFVALAGIQSRILIEEGEYLQAKDLLEKALELYPEYPGLKAQLKRLEEIEENWGWGLGLEDVSRIRKAWRRDAQRYRRRQQKKLKNPHPTIAEALGIYTKEQLKAMGWHIAPEGGWSALRKQALLDLLTERMKQPETLGRLLGDLSPYERKAVEEVLARGGVMDWEAFSDAFGDDLIESPYWEFHEPQTPMGRLRIRGLIVEAWDGDKLVISIPVELRQTLAGESAS